MRIGFLGLGRMGLPMASRLQQAGHEVVAYDTDATARARAEAAGVTVVDSPARFADRAVVCSSLPETEHVAAAYAGSGGIFDIVAPGTICVDLSTISVAGSQELAAMAADRELSFLDAPVSGTSIHAEAGTLVVMAGGRRDALDAVRPALDGFAASVNHVGPSGSGLLLKLITNRLLTAHLTAIAEAILEMEAAGLDVARGVEIIRAGAVPRLLEYKAAPLIARDFSPQFTVDLMRKDLRLAAEVLPDTTLAALIRDVLETAAAAGRGAEDLAALISVLEVEIAAAD